MPALYVHINICVEYRTIVCGAGAAQGAPDISFYPKMATVAHI